MTVVSVNGIVSVIMGVKVNVGVGGTGVSVGVDVLVAVGVLVDVAVDVGVPVDVDVAVDVAVNVAVGFLVGVLVGVAVAAIAVNKLNWFTQKTMMTNSVIIIPRPIPKIRVTACLLTVGNNKDISAKQRLNREALRGQSRNVPILTKDSFKKSLEHRVAWRTHGDTQREFLILSFLRESCGFSV